MSFPNTQAEVSVSNIADTFTRVPEPQRFLLTQGSFSSVLHLTLCFYMVPVQHVHWDEPMVWGQEEGCCSSLLAGLGLA